MPPPTALAGRIETVEALRRLSDAVVGKTDVRAALTALNRSVLAGMGYQVDGITFSDKTLCSILGLASPSSEEIEILRQWRRARPHGPSARSDPHGHVVVPIHLTGRIAGILRLTGARAPRPEESQFLRALADGIGDIAYKAKLRRVGERRARELAVAFERERIARDLHDTVGQIFYGLCLKSQRCLKLDPDRIEHRQALTAELEEISRLASEGIGDVRAAVFSLAFLHVKAGGLLHALRKLVDEFSLATGVEARLRTAGPRRRLPDHVESALYRVAHEALTNVDRHARASGVVISLRTENGAVSLTVRDDGVGLDQRQALDWRSSAHFGVRMMARSIDELGGTFRVEAVQPRGLAIHASIPLSLKSHSLEPECL